MVDESYIWINFKTYFKKATTYFLTAEDCTEDEECKIDLIVVVDESGSVAIDSMKIGGPNYWEEDMRPFLRELYRGLNIGMDRTRVAQIMYSNE